MRTELTEMETVAVYVISALSKGDPVAALYGAALAVARARRILELEPETVVQVAGTDVRLQRSASGALVVVSEGPNDPV